MSTADFKNRPAKSGRNKFLPLAVIFLVIVLGVIGGSVYMRWRQNHEAYLKKRKAEIRIEVLNGTKKSGLGQEVAVKLRQNGFDVVDVANAENDSFPETVVVDRADDGQSNAILVAKELKCKNVIPQIEPTSLLEVTVIIGQDYLKEKKKGFLGISF
jgi:hypothetical protein